MELQKQDFVLEMAFTTVSARRLGKLGVEENKKHDAFVEIHGRLMGMSAVVEPQGGSTRASSRTVRRSVMSSAERPIPIS